MATDTLMAPLPQLQLEPGFVIKLEAVDPATGLAVAGVNVQAATAYGDVNEVGNPTELTPGVFMFVPGPEA